MGLLAAAGLDSAPVYKIPVVAVIATGDEVVLPGTPLSEGKLYASNMVTLCSWLSLLGVSHVTALVPDRRDALERTVKELMAGADMFLTSGGAWGSERDLVLQVVETLGWQGVYHRVRLGPGKPVAFGLLQDRPFFCLPGGPPSNEMAFLQLALPALLKMMGDDPLPFPVVPARLAETVFGKKDWTDFVHARLETEDNRLVVYPARLKSALLSMARKQALITIPEGIAEIPAGENVNIQVLPTAGHPAMSRFNITG